MSLKSIGLESFTLRSATLRSASLRSATLRSPLVLSCVLALACTAGGGSSDAGEGNGDGDGDGDGELAGAGGSGTGSVGNTDTGGTTSSSGGGPAAGGGSGSGGAGQPGSGGAFDANDPTVGCVETTGQAIVDVGDGTLFDPNTCLMWMKTPFTETESGVVGEVTGILHAQSCSTRTDAGRDDWRGPEIAEMRTLTTDCGIWNNDGYMIPELEFVGTPDSEFRYWTVTAGSDGDHTCLLIGATGEFTGGRRKQDNARVTCVRGTSSLTGSETVCTPGCP